jgi:aurora kinase
MFELGRKLGKGRFGDVYMAREIRTGFALAIKVINKKELKESEM